MRAGFLRHRSELDTTLHVARKIVIVSRHHVSFSRAFRLQPLNIRSELIQGLVRPGSSGAQMFLAQGSDFSEFPAQLCISS